MSYPRLQAEEQRLAEEVEVMCAAAGSTDGEEDGLYGIDQRGDELPEELQHRQARLATIRAAKARLEQAQREADEARGRHADDDRKPPGRGGRHYKRDFGVPEEKAQSNFTDPESRIMNTADGFQQCYNGQLAVDGEFQLIVENSLSANGSDNGELLGLLDGIERTLKARPQRVLADAGYRNEADLIELEAREMDAYISLGKEGKVLGNVDPSRYPATARMAEKLTEPEAKECNAQRKHLSEAVNAWIKHVIGFRQFSVRGLAKAGGEWDLVCMATNLRRMRPLMVFD